MKKIEEVFVFKPSILFISLLLLFQINYPMDSVKDITYEKKLNIVCSQPCSTLNTFSKSIAEVIEEQNRSDNKDREWVEAVLRISQLLPELQKYIFNVIHEQSNMMSTSFSEGKSIAYNLHSYADMKEFGFCKDAWLVIDRGRCFKRGAWHQSIRFNYDQFLMLPLDEKVLLKKVIEGNICAFGGFSQNDIQELSEDQRKQYGIFYKVQEEELGTVRNLLNKNISYENYRDSWEQSTESDLAKTLRVDIEYGGITVKDKMLIAFPLIVNCLLPDLFLHGLCTGMACYLPVNGWWVAMGLQTVGGLATCAGSAFVGYQVGSKLFPALDRHNSGVVQLKKFFGNKVRLNIKQGGSFALKNILQFLCASMGRYFILSSSFITQGAGCIIYLLRVLLFKSMFTSFEFKNPIDRRAPCTIESFSPQKRNATTYSYVLRDMQQS